MRYLLLFLLVGVIISSCKTELKTVHVTDPMPDSVYKVKDVEISFLKKSKISGKLVLSHFQSNSLSVRFNKKGKVIWFNSGCSGVSSIKKIYSEKGDIRFIASLKRREYIDDSDGAMIRTYVDGPVLCFNNKGELNNIYVYNNEEFAEVFLQNKGNIYRDTTSIRSLFYFTGHLVK